MNEYIAYCGLDCERCEAYIATQKNDDRLRAAVAEKWSRLNNVLITPDQINCDGCRKDGRKTVFCESLCEIRRCATKNGYVTCGGCGKTENCEKLKIITANNAAARENLKKVK